MLKFPDGWESILKDEYNKDYFKRLDRVVEKEYLTNNVYPKRDEIFKALELTAYNDVKCVILAQDPYPGTDRIGKKHAHGLAFSSLSSCEIPKSLQNIYKELENCIDGFKIPNHADLTEWGKQGVLLLNNALTVVAGISNSHAKIGWEILTETIIKTLGENEKPIAFCLWGNFAQRKESLITGKNKLILKASHPSPLSARHSFFGCQHFKQVNEFLIKNKIEPINWQL